MYPKQHLFLGIIFAIFLFIFFSEIGIIGILIILLSAIFIDVDHYIYYVYQKNYALPRSFLGFGNSRTLRCAISQEFPNKKKDFSLINAYENSMDKTKKFLLLPKSERNNAYLGFYFLHGIEILFLILALSFFSKYFLFIFAGFSFHLLLDIVHQTTYWDRIDKFSLIYDYIKFKDKKFFQL